VRLAHDDGHDVGEAAIGDGPVDAVLRAIERATGMPLELTRFQIDALGEGADAQGHAQLSARHAARDWRGHGSSTDIVEAAALAALAIVNRIARQSAPILDPSGLIEECGHGRPLLDPRAHGRAHKETTA